jgi:hypothetical protein
VCDAVAQHETILVVVRNGGCAGAGCRMREARSDESASKPFLADE